METGMISSASGTTYTSSATRTPSSNLDKDSFLKLFVAQLKNQDPTSSTANDPNAMVQQLTAYAGLEQAQQTNTLLSGLQNQTSGLFQAQTASMVGKNVKVSGSSFSLANGKATLNVELPQSADVTVVVKDANGNTIATLPQGTLGRGANTITWDGRTAAGFQAPDGTYSVAVNAVDSTGKAVKPTTSVTMKVDAVTFKDGGIYLSSGSSSFSLKDVLEILA